MIEELHKPGKDRVFLSMLDEYERELHAIDSTYPIGRTVFFLDVDRIRTFIAVENENYAGFIVIEIKDGECEIHEFYVPPLRRNAMTAKALLKHAVSSFSRLVFNIAKSNTRVQILADHFLKMAGATVATSDKRVWGTDCVHYEVELNSGVHGMFASLPP